MRMLVNIRGCNGSGKSTIPLLMMDKDKEMCVEYMRWEGKKKAIATVFPTLGWVALGTYFNKTGGMDTFKNNDMTQKALSYVLESCPEYDILMEGVIASTIKSTYADLFHRVSKKYSLQILILSMLPPLEVCLERIQQRNGGKPINEEAVASKWKIVDRNVEYFREQGFTSIKVNTAKISKNKMLEAFNNTIEKYRED